MKKFSFPRKCEPQVSSRSVPLRKEKSDPGGRFSRRERLACCARAAGRSPAGPLPGRAPPDARFRVNNKYAEGKHLRAERARAPGPRTAG